MIKRIVFGVLGLVGVLALAAAAGAYWFLSGDGIRRALEQQATDWLGQPVRIGRVATQFYPRVGLSLTSVTAGDPVAITLAEVGVSTDLRALLGRRIENAEITVTDSRVQMPLPVRRAVPASAGGRAAAGGVTLISIRTIALRNVRLLSRGHELTVSGESALDGTRLTVRRFTAQSAGTSLEAEGVVELSPRVEATVRVKANTLDVDALMALAEAFAPARPAGARAGALPRIAARISAERARAGSLEVRQFATEMNAEGSTVSLSPLTFQVFGGRYQGSMAAQLGKAMQVTIRARLLDLDVAQLAEFGGVPGAVTGTLSGAGTFSGSGTDMSGVLRTARGEGSATIVNGTVRRLNLIRTVVLFFGRPAPGAAPGTDAFTRIDTTAALANGVVTASAMAMRSADADIVGSGTLNLETAALDGRFDLSLSEALSAQAGTDLRRFTLEGARVVLPARLSGQLGEPRLMIDAQAAVRRGLRNEVRRRLGGLLDRLGQ